MKSSPAFQLYASDFLVGTADMTPEEVGIYIRLLCYQWNKGFLPNDPQKLSLLAGCTCNALASVMHKFEVKSGGLQNRRMEEVREKQDAFRASRAKNASSGHKSEHMQNTCNASAVQVHDTRKKKIEEEDRSTEKENSRGGCKGEENSLSIRLNQWFGRRMDTVWSDKERAALRKIEDMNIPSEDLDALEAYYLSGAPYLRTEMMTLMNNFNGEIDRAKKWKSNPQSFLKNGTQTHKSNPRNAGVAGAETAGADAERAVKAMEARRRASYAMAAQVPEGNGVVPSQNSGNGHGSGDLLLPICEKPS